MGAPGTQRARVLGFLLAGLLGVSIAQSVYNIPIQVSDSVEVIIESRRPVSSWALMTEMSRSSATTLRPVRYLQARWLGELADAAGVPNHVVFRGVHAALALAIVVLFAWVARVRSLTDVAALGVALTVLVGHHTFGAMMRESFPVNHYAEVACGALVILGIAQRRPRLAGQVTAVVILAAGLLLIESAVLLWVVLVGCVALRFPGLSRRTAVAATVVLALYLAARPLLGIRSPGLGGHGTGWLAASYSADEVVARFGANPWPFYAYNVLAGALSVVASEPRSGVYRVLEGIQTGNWPPVVAIHLISSLVLSMVIAAYARTAWRRPETRQLWIALAILVVSALLCATYVKDDIVSTAGVFNAVAAYVALCLLFDGGSERGLRPAIALVGILSVAPLWAFRSVGTHFDLRQTAFVTRNDWVTDRPSWIGDSQERYQRFTALRAEAIRHRVTSPSFLPRWERYWVE